MSKQYTEIEGLKYELCLNPPTDDPEFPSYLQPICDHIQSDLDLTEDLYYGDVSDRLSKWDLESEGNFQQRKSLTLFSNFFKKAVKTFPGFLSDIRGTEKLYSGLVENISDIDSCGNDLSSFFWQADLEAIKSGFCGILVDCSKEIEANKPYLVLIRRSSILSWSECFDSNQTRYNRITIKECISEAVGTFGTQVITRYKTFFDDGSYLTQVILMDDDKPYVTTIEEGKSSIQAIPIVMYSATDLDPTRSEPPLSELAKKNLAHYQLYSEYRNIIFRLNNPAIVRTGLVTPGQTDFSKLPPIVLGGSIGLDVPIGGDLKYVEPSGNCLATDRLELDKLEESMTKDTIEFIFGGGNRTATEVNLSSVSANANLSGMAILKQSAIEQVSELWASYYSDFGMGGTCTVNKDLLNIPLNSQDMQALSGMVLNNTLSNVTFLELMNEGKRMPKGVTPALEVKRIDAQKKRNAKIENKANLVKPDDTQNSQNKV